MLNSILQDAITIDTFLICTAASLLLGAAII
jgi:hypothetical protein